MRPIGKGSVSPDDLDKTIRGGPGLRWALLGPFATIELDVPGGVADYCARYSVLYRRLAADLARPAGGKVRMSQRSARKLGPPHLPDELEVGHAGATAA